MARMLPELTDEQLRALRSRAEARFYEACRDQLPDEVLVIHGASWVYRDVSGRVREGEADFTLVMPQSGIVTVEVKGGGVAFEPAAGKWFSVDRNGQRHEIKDPFRQASNERHAILDQLTGHALWRQWRGSRLTLGHAVVLPDINDSRPIEGPDRPIHIIGVSRDLDSLVPWLDRVVRFWRQDSDSPLGAQGVRLVEGILGKSIEVGPILRSALEDAEIQRIRLTKNQAKILRIVGGRKRAVISGGAGTGKTLIAAEKARQLAQAGLSVLLLCYNRPLADALSFGFQDEPRVKVMNFHQLCDGRITSARTFFGRDLLAEAKVAYPGSSSQHLFDVQMPYALALSNEVLDEKYDAVVVDEAQDFSDEYWFAVEELLRDQLDGYLYIFIDENQALYRRHGNLPVPDEPFHLTANCRNTAPIHDVGYAFYNGEPVDGPELAGPAVERITVEDDTTQAEAITRRVRRLVVDEGILPEDVVVLIAKRPKARLYELILARPLPSGVTWAVEAHGQRGAISVDTVARFKGLEAQAVLLWLGDEVVDEQQWEAVYVGTTRAKSLLCVVGSVRALTVIE